MDESIRVCKKERIDEKTGISLLRENEKKEKPESARCAISRTRETHIIY